MSAAADFDVELWLSGSADKADNEPPRAPLFPALSLAIPPIVEKSHAGGELPFFGGDLPLPTPTSATASSMQPLLFDGPVPMKTESEVVFDQGVVASAAALSNHLSPLSDISSPSDLEVNPASPQSPVASVVNHNLLSMLQSEHSSSGAAAHPRISQMMMMEAAAAAMTTDADCESDSRAASPASEASSEISNTSMVTENSPTGSARPAAKPAKSARATAGKPRAKRRNLMNALREHLANVQEDANSSGSDDSDLMQEILQPPQTGRRGKRSHSSLDADDESAAADGDGDEKAPTSKRERNKQSASAYRKRRKMYLDTLESRVQQLSDKLSDQAQAMSKVENENKVLKEQLSFLKRLISFKNADAAAAAAGAGASASAAASGAVAPAVDKMAEDESVSTASFAAPAGFASDSRLGLLRYNTAGSRNAGMFLFLLFSCFLLFNPMWSSDLGTAISHGAGGDATLAQPVGRLTRNILEHHELESDIESAYRMAPPSSIAKFLDERTLAAAASAAFAPPAPVNSVVITPEPEPAVTALDDAFAASPAPEQSAAAAAPAASSAAASSAAASESSPDLRVRALSELDSLAQSFRMDPQSKQFAELVATSYLPLVNILGEAATQAALRDLASGVFFVQQQALFHSLRQVAASNATSIAK